MRYLKVFENFGDSGKLKAGMIIEDSYYSNNGAFVIKTNEGEFEIGCAGSANVVVTGDSNTGKIVNVDIQFTIITIELEGGKKIVIEDETGGEGLEIYEVEQSEDVELEDSEIMGQIEKMAEQYSKQFDYPEDSDPYTSFIEGAKAVLNLIKR